MFVKALCSRTRCFGSPQPPPPTPFPMLRKPGPLSSPSASPKGTGAGTLSIPLPRWGIVSNGGMSGAGVRLRPSVHSVPGQRRTARRKAIFTLRLRSCSAQNLCSKTRAGIVRRNVASISSFALLAACPACPSTAFSPCRNPTLPPGSISAGAGFRQRFGGSHAVTLT